LSAVTKLFLFSTHASSAATLEKCAAKARTVI